MRKSSISHEKKIEAVERYKRGEANQKSIAREYGVDESSFRQWIANYEAMGPSGLAAVHAALTTALWRASGEFSSVKCTTLATLRITTAW